MAFALGARSECSHHSYDCNVKKWKIKTATTIWASVMIENHPLQPFLPKHAQVLVLGSFPPPKYRWKIEFYYSNFQNDMWRIMGLIFFKDKDHFIDTINKQFKESELKDFLNRQGIAIYDVAEKVIRHQENASDKHLEVIKSTDLGEILNKIPNCNTIITTGDKATQILMQGLPNTTLVPKIHQPSFTKLNQRILRLYRLPSSSRAYPLALSQKAKIYADCFRKIFTNLD